MSLSLLNNIYVMYLYFVIYNIEYNLGEDQNGNNFFVLTSVFFMRVFIICRSTRSTLLCYFF